MRLYVGELIEKRLDLFTVTDCGKNYSSAINLLANKTVSVDLLHAEPIPFDKAAEVYERLSSGAEDGSLKTLIKI